MTWVFRSDEWERTIVFNAIGEPWICLVSGKPFSEPFLKFYIRELQSVSFKGHLKLHNAHEYWEGNWNSISLSLGNASHATKEWNRREGGGISRRLPNVPIKFELRRGHDDCRIMQEFIYRSCATDGFIGCRFHATDCDWAICCLEENGAVRNGEYVLSSWIGRILSALLLR